MRRRNFVSAVGSVAGAAALIPGCSGQRNAAAGKRALMKLGCQNGTSDEALQFKLRMGVQAVRAEVPIGSPADVFKKERERIERTGITLDQLSMGTDRTGKCPIMLGKSPERDREIEKIQEYIRNCAAAGIPGISYYLTLLGILRTERELGRGGNSYTAWHLADGQKQAFTAPKESVSADTVWERLDYFLERVIPVAAEYKIRMAHHPHDPSVPPGFRGVNQVLGTVDGLKKYIALRENPYHGLNFCQGTVCEMLVNPGKEIFDVIRYFGTRKKIFNVHFRNIRGGLNNFRETMPDEGDVDFFEAMKVYKEVEYAYMIMPDHVPSHPDDPGSRQAMAFAYGHVRALIQAVDRLG